MDRRQFLIDGALAAGALACGDVGIMSSIDFAPEQIVVTTNGADENEVAKKVRARAIKQRRVMEGLLPSYKRIRKQVFAHQV